MGRLKVKSEADVEQRFLLPLLAALGYANDEVTAKAPIVFQTGRKGRKHEADLIVHHGNVLNADTSLIVVEAKTPEQDLEEARRQAESYAHASRAPFLLLSDGVKFEIWQVQVSRHSERALACHVHDLPRNRGEVERLIGRAAAVVHCRALGYKSLFPIVNDVSSYIETELARPSGRPGIPRRLRVDGKPTEALAAMKAVGQGAFVLAPSGYGKTTLAADLYRHWLTTLADAEPIPFLIPLPDLAELDQSPEDYIRDRLSARCPQFASAAAFADLLDVRGARIICDGLDRIGYKAQRAFLARAATLMRDRPKVRFVVLGRTQVQNGLGLPSLDLLPLDKNERQALAASISLPRGAMTLHSFPSILEPLMEHPLLLTLLLEHHQRTGSTPTRLDELFETWLARLLEVDGHGPAMVARLRDLLARFAMAISGSARSRGQVLATVRVDADELLDALVRTNALVLGERVELLHDALGDYLRAEALLDSPTAEIEVRIADERFTPGSLFPALLMSKCRNPELREAIWRRIGKSGLDIYLDVLRFGGGVDHLAAQSDVEMSTGYLREFRNGIVQPASWYMSRIEPELAPVLVDGPAERLGVWGRVDPDRRWFSYGFYVAGKDDPPITVAPPAASAAIGGFNLERHLGAKNARRMGFERLRDALTTVILRRRLKGGPEWLNERLLGRLRFALRAWKRDIPLDTDLKSISRLLVPCGAKLFTLMASATADGRLTICSMTSTNCASTVGAHSILGGIATDPIPRRAMPTPDKWHLCLMNIGGARRSSCASWLIIASQT